MQGSLALPGPEDDSWQLGCAKKAPLKSLQRTLTHTHPLALFATTPGAVFVPNSPCACAYA